MLQEGIILPIRLEHAKRPEDGCGAPPQRGVRHSACPIGANRSSAAGGGEAETNPPGTQTARVASCPIDSSALFFLLSAPVGLGFGKRRVENRPVSHSMARRKRSTSDDPEGTRTRILHAAEEVFGEKGYTGARVAEIARRSGMDKRLIFYYFRTKQGLYSQILENFFDRAAPLLDGFLRKRTDKARKIDPAEFLENMTEFIQANRNAVRILFREFLDGGLMLEKLLADRIFPILRLWRDYYPLSFSLPRDSPREADHMLLTLSGMSLFYFLVVPLMQKVWNEDPLWPDRLSERKEFLRRRAKGLIQ